MRECNKIFRDVASKLDCFVGKIAANFGKVCKKFLKDFWTGLLAGQSVLITEISRGIKLNISLKKQIEKLCRHLAKDSFDDLLPQYHQTISSEINDRTIFCVDNTDIIKPYGEKFEDLGRVRDGSTGNTEKGYEIVNIVALTPHHKQPIPLYSYLFSNIEPNYVSNNIETKKALTCIRTSFGSIGIKVFDRGYDDSELFRYLINNSEKFIIRCKKNRDVYFNNKKINILDIVKHSANEIRSNFTKGSKTYALTYKKYNVKIQGMNLNLIVVTGFGKDPMFLLTNLTLDKEFETTIAKLYMLRWKIEETHRFEKEVLKLEHFRVRSLKAMRNVVLLTAILSGFIALICEHQHSKLFKRLLEMSQTLKKKPLTDRAHGFKKNHLFFYSIARAISDLFSAYKLRGSYSSP